MNPNAEFNATTGFNPEVHFVFGISKSFSELFGINLSYKGRLSNFIFLSLFYKTSKTEYIFSGPLVWVGVFDSGRGFIGSWFIEVLQSHIS
jgi:hypothetical protein